MHQPDHLRGDVQRVPAGLQEPADVPAEGVTVARGRTLGQAAAVTSRHLQGKPKTTLKTFVIFIGSRV